MSRAIENYHDRERPVPHGEDDMDETKTNERRGCGDGGCVFRPPSSRGQHTNGGCRCVPLRMTPNERVVLRRWIRSEVTERDALRAEVERLRELVDDDDDPTMDPACRDIVRFYCG